ncbi:MAG: protein BatD [Halieaceae bacterium]|nr:protein BatD [Halieaceae bacterium]
MNRLGKTLITLLFIITIGLGQIARADLVASVDRDRIAMGDTFELTITATAGEDINQLRLRPLLAEFDLLQRSTSSSTSINNGRRTSTHAVVLQLSPKREGSLSIPALLAGADQSNFLLISVAPAPRSSAGDSQVRFEAELDRDTVYVQGQVILTLRLLQAINLDARSITELHLENAFVKPLEQKVFSRTMGGQNWAVHEIRYAIFPEQSGTFEIPSQTFSAREGRRRQSIFDRGNNGPALRRSTKAISIKVLPRPTSFKGTTWLPAHDIRLDESWSTPPDQLRVGESATRTVKITSEGLMGAQLPPVQFAAGAGLKFYPDQPSIADTELASGLMGSREDSAALVPTRDGSWELPEIRIPWWDVKSNAVRYAVLPATRVLVAAAELPLDFSLPAPINQQPNLIPITAPTPMRDATPWRTIAGIAFAGWLMTILYLIYGRMRRRPASVAAAYENPSEKLAFKQLLAACSTGNAARARSGLIAWCATLLPNTPAHSLERVAMALDDPQLSANLKQLNACLYDDQNTHWDGNELLCIAQRLRKQKQQRATKDNHPLQLYPNDLETTS